MFKEIATMAGEAAPTEYNMTLEVLNRRHTEDKKEQRQFYEKQHTANTGER